MMQTDIMTIQRLNHDNIIRLLGFGNMPVMNEEDGTIGNQLCMVTDLATRGDLFEFIAQTGGLQDRFARFVMRQVFTAVRYIHNMGVVHRNLKLESILLDDDFNIKLKNFSYSGHTAGRTATGFLTTYCGTPGYIAPEVHVGIPYRGIKVDMFALGVTLFTLIAQRPPFD